jgi:hypothetical protein
LHIETTNRQVVDNATIKIYGISQHGYGLPTQPRVFPDYGNGSYLLEGMKFHVPGWWAITIIIMAVDHRDSVTFNLILHEQVT